MATTSKRQRVLITLTLQLNICIFTLSLLDTLDGPLSRMCSDSASLVLFFRDSLGELRDVGIMSSSTKVVPVLLMVLGFYMREKRYSMGRIVLSGLAPVLLAQIAHGVVMVAFSHAMESGPYNISLVLISAERIFLCGPAFLALCTFFCVVSVLVADLVGRKKATQ